VKTRLKTAKVDGFGAKVMILIGEGSAADNVRVSSDRSHMRCVRDLVTEDVYSLGKASITRGGAGGV
jgi:hypothetical protein